MDGLQSLLDSFLSFIPQLVIGIVLILVAWIVAVLVKNAITKGLKAVGAPGALSKWGAAANEDAANSTIDSLGKVGYYLVWVLFLPGIFQQFGLNAIGTPIQNMINTVLSYLPSVIGAAIILAVGIFAANFVRNLVYNLLKTANVDSYLSKLTGASEDEGETKQQKDTLASALAGVVYFLVIVPIAIVALETLGIASITQPIVGVLDTILAAIPSILVAVVLLVVGGVIAKIVGDLLTNLLEGTGLNKASKYLRENANVDINLAKVSGQVVAGLIILLFFVEALNALNLQILNTVGSAIIAYLPNIIVAGLILGAVFVGGQFLGTAVKKSTNSTLASVLVKYLLIGFGVFMALDQLNFASSIVSQAFVLILGAVAVAFAIAFGLGGRDFARKQLEKADQTIDKETRKAENSDSNIDNQN